MSDYEQFDEKDKRFIYLMNKLLLEKNILEQKYNLYPKNNMIYLKLQNILLEINKLQNSYFTS